MNLFFNKTYDLCYEKYLKQFDGLEIVAVKTASFIKQVNYKEIVDTLYNETISDNTVEDLHIKKNIANVNIGLLEKGCNKNVESFIYTTLEEAEYYQNIFGGNIITIQKIEETEEYTEEWVETDFGDEQLVIKKTIGDFIADGNVYYVLNISRKTTLINGFRYIKELVIQNHNCKIYIHFKFLNNNNNN